MEPPLNNNECYHLNETWVEILERNSYCLLYCLLTSCIKSTELRPFGVETLFHTEVNHPDWFQIGLKENAHLLIGGGLETASRDRKPTAGLGLHSESTAAGNMKYLILGQVQTGLCFSQGMTGGIGGSEMSPYYNIFTKFLRGIWVSNYKQHMAHARSEGH